MKFSESVKEVGITNERTNNGPARKNDDPTDLFLFFPLNEKVNGRGAYVGRENSTGAKSSKS